VRFLQQVFILYYLFLKFKLTSTFLAIMNGEEGSITALISEVVRVGQLSQVSVQKHTNLLNLRDKSEDIASFFKLSPEAILLRYLSCHFTLIILALPSHASPISFSLLQITPSADGSTTTSPPRATRAQLPILAQT
jgi:hypothetical protein